MHSNNKPFFTVLPLILFLFLLDANAQLSPSILNKRITISVAKQPIILVMKQIESEAGVRFMFNSLLLENKPAVTLKHTNTTIKELLKRMINDPNIVFYELNKYIIITKRKEVPAGTSFEQAIVQTVPQSTERVVLYDTIKVFDTITSTDTVRFAIYDTIMVYDTVQIERRASTKPALPPATRYKTNGVNKLRVSAEIAPLFAKMAGNTCDEGLLTYMGEGMVSIGNKNMSAGIGLSYFEQRGTARGFTSVTRLDSTIHKASKTVTHRYIVGEYYYDSSGITVHRTVYDSVSVTVPYEWTSYHGETNTRTERLYHILRWLGVPLRFSWFTGASKHVRAGVSVCITPAFALGCKGSVNHDEGDTLIALSASTIPRVSLFASISPELIYDISERTSLYVCPIVGASLLPVVKGETYRLLSAGVRLGWSYSIFLY